MIPILRYCFVAILVLALAQHGFAETDTGLLPDRRKPQFMNDQGYYVFPMPYSIPGVGAGLGIMGIGMNLGGTYTDAFGFVLGGGLKGEGGGITEIHLVPRTLLLDITGMNFGKSTITNFKQRGMETDKHDFSYLEFNNYYFAGGRLTATFADRLLEFYGGGYRIGAELDKVLDQNKNTILETQDSPKWRSKVYGLGVRGDLTDDYYDPRRGVRLDVSRWWSPPAKSSDPDFFRIEYNASAYLPLGKRSTWVLNYFRSDAHVDRKGETDRLAIENEQGLNCGDPTLTPQEKRDCDSVVGNIIAISQTDIKRMLAYSSIAHAGYILMAFVPYGNPDVRNVSVAAGLFYLVSYAVTNFGAWAVVISLETKAGKGLTLDDYSGLAKRYPALAAAMTVFILSLIGFPPTLGMVGKFYLFRAVIDGGFIWLAIIGVVTSLISAFYYLRVVVNMYMREGDPATESETWLDLSTGATALLTITLSLVPGFLFAWASEAVLKLF